MTRRSSRTADESGRDGWAAPPGRSSQNVEKQHAAPSPVHDTPRSPGTVLAQATRAAAEGQFKHDFSRIQVHSYAQASESEPTRAIRQPHMVASAGREPDQVPIDHRAERSEAVAGENAGNAVAPAHQAASGLQHQQASAGGGVTLSYTKSAPVQGRCGDFDWQIRWVLQGATSATNGFIVQKVKRETLTQHCDNTSDHTFDLYWEAWQVKAGKVLAGMSETDESKGDLFAWSGTMGSKGTTYIAGSAKFMENFAEPFKWGRIKESGTLRGTLQQPAGWSEAGSKYRYIGVSDFSCCNDGQIPGKLTTEELDV